jgi:AbiV family abortive infection protein
MPRNEGETHGRVGACVATRVVKTLSQMESLLTLMNADSERNLSPAACRTRALYFPIMADVRIELLSHEQKSDFRRTLLANARALHADAALLLDAGRHARSCSLALLGFEELAKLQPLWSTKLQPSQQTGTDWEYLKKLMTSHNDKIAVALFTEHLLCAIFSVEHHEDSIVKGLTPLDHLTNEARRLNRLKQDGFYVGFDGARFLIPSDVITERIAAPAVARLKSMLATFSAFDRLCSIPGTPTKEQVLEAKHSAQQQQ